MNLLLSIYGVKMIKSFELILRKLLLFSFFRCTFQELSPGSECNTAKGINGRTVKISLNCRKNETGEWVDTFIARTESSNSSDHLNLDVTHTVSECDGKRVVYIKGVTIDKSHAANEEKITFHSRCGKNIAISNKGLTVQKINLEDPVNSVAFTNRPLKNNEIFEVRLDKKNSKFSQSLGIGITTLSPTDIDFPAQMYTIKNSWIYHNDNVYSDNKEYLKYKARNLNSLQVGDRIGVMRNEYGALHFFVNGVDQGPAMSNVPESVYGVFELWNSAEKATIVYATTLS